MRPLAARELDDVVALWVRARWAAQPWLEARMGYTAEDNLAYFRGVIARDCVVLVAAAGGARLGFIALAGGSIEHLYVDPPEQSRAMTPRK